MTLDLAKYFENIIDKEAVISHFSVRINAGETKKVKMSIANSIKKEYGDLFLEDADFVLFFTRTEGWSAKDVNKIFELTDRALGKEANKLTKSDFKKLIKSSTKTSEPDLDDDISNQDDVSEELAEEITTTLFVKVTLK